MSEKDLSLKASSRRLMWRMGFSTKVDVPLRAFVPQPKSGGRARSQYESFTDLDVLGVHVTPDLRVQSIIADCKTSAKGSTERMFWIRGVADFFCADDAYMVRQDEPTAAARQLASRLGVAVLTSTDLSSVDGHYPAELPPIDFLFDPSTISGYRQALVGLDKRLLPLREYQEYDFWVYEEHRNLQQLVAHLGDVGKHMDPTIPSHQALFFEAAWRYALSIARAAHQVRRSHVVDVDTSLREYIFGGQLALREKQQLAKVLRAAAGKGDSDAEEGIFPAYFAALLELTNRFLRRPLHVTSVLRYAEWAAEAHHVREVSPAASVFGPGYDDIAAKLLADVCGFLVTTAHLDLEFRTRARQVLAPGSPTAGGQRGKSYGPSSASMSQTELPLTQADERSSEKGK
jgi:hypothetical protein